jgi:hypothetical protein
LLSAFFLFFGGGETFRTFDWEKIEDFCKSIIQIQEAQTHSKVSQRFDLASHAKQSK